MQWVSPVAVFVTARHNDFAVQTRLQQLGMKPDPSSVLLDQCFKLSCAYSDEHTLLRLRFGHLRGIQTRQGYVEPSA